MLKSGKILGDEKKQLACAIKQSQGGADVVLIVGTPERAEFCFRLAAFMMADPVVDPFEFGFSVGAGSLRFASVLKGLRAIQGHRGPVLIHKHAFTSVIASRRAREFKAFAVGCNAQFGAVVA
jgi:hypothetical protein